MRAVIGDGFIICAQWVAIAHINIRYRTLTFISPISNPNLFEIYPSLSSGIFNIKSSADHLPKKIFVTDGEGRIVYSSATNFSEINLSDFEVGIYFYAVEDESQKVYWGKIIKI